MSGSLTPCPHPTTAVNPVSSRHVSHPQHDLQSSGVEAGKSSRDAQSFCRSALSLPWTTRLSMRQRCLILILRPIVSYQTPAIEHLFARALT
jgi:hypothetical protein